MDENLKRLQFGTQHDPFHVLGWHPSGEQWVLRTFMPAAEQVRCNGQTFKRIAGTDSFEWIGERSLLGDHPLLEWQDKRYSEWYTAICPYTFSQQLGDLDLHLFREGHHHDVWKMLGAHPQVVDGVDGVLFAVWAPAVQRVSVIGDFNAWDGRRYPMRSRGDSGVWELFIPGLAAGAAYKYEILGRHGQLLKKADPYGQQMFMRPETASRIAPISVHAWQDEAWLSERSQLDWLHKPMSIYEVHAGSWRRHPDNRFYTWRELADSLIPHAVGLGYTHIELLPISEYPLDESWGYQVSGYFAPTARFGTPDDFRYFIDQCHLQNIGVLLDWVPAHFPKDEFALARFTGETVYEYADPRKGEHQDWGTLIFDYGRNEVKNFLLANALYWLEEFHIDGLRVDAVASMLYLDYSRQHGQWAPNQHGGREHLEAIAFLRELNMVVHQRFPGVVTIAEESTAWPAVSRPTYIGGLGFSMKWNMGWMNDNLSYIALDPIYRQYQQNKLTFSQMYAWTENFVLPLSHDEVVHLKRSLLDKMPGDRWQRFANLRLFYTWHYAHPGKKLLFMGGEFGQWSEWSERHELDWNLCALPEHDGLLSLVGELNQVYRGQSALHRHDFEAQGFRWLDCDDAQHSLLSFMRLSDNGEIVIVLLNFTPVARDYYRLGVPEAGDYTEIFNSDATRFAGSGYGNPNIMPSGAEPCMGQNHSIAIRVPPLAGVMFKRCVVPTLVEKQAVPQETSSAEAEVAVENNTKGTRE